MQLCKDYNGMPSVPPFEPKTGTTFMGIVPVRGGSKGLRGKNMRLLGGKPLYRWVADAARASGVFQNITVMSDWPELLEDAAKAGYGILCEPPELAADGSYVTKAMAWACQVLAPRRTYLQLLQATSPFLKPQHIQQAASMAQMLDADMVVGLTPSRDPTAFNKIVPPDWSLSEWYPKEFRGKRRQDLPKTWSLNGYVYLAKWEVWAEEKDWWQSRIYGLPMSEAETVDIDTLEDFTYAEFILRRQPGKIRSLCTTLRHLFFCD
jgi:CMP-N,N'-diacetyllegionaminic acid synthase